MVNTKKQVKSVKANAVYNVSRDLHESGQLSNWGKAADDARLKIKEHQKKIRLLRQAVRVFEKYGQQGEPWPGNEIVGQDG